MPSLRSSVTRLITPVLLVIGALSLPLDADAEPGVYPERIVFGQSAAFDGPARALGLGMREGILAAFALSKDSKGVALANKALATEHENLRFQALHTLAAIQNVKAMDGIIAHLKSATRLPR